jgi:hypothetical protein
MPELREDNGKCGKHGAEGGEEHADLAGLVPGDQVGGQLLENGLQLAGAGGGVIGAAGHVSDLLQGGLIDAAAEAAATAEAKEPAALIAVVTVRAALPAETEPAAKLVGPGWPGLGAKANRGQPPVWRPPMVAGRCC